MTRRGICCQQFSLIKVSQSLIYLLCSTVNCLSIVYLLGVFDSVSFDFCLQTFSEYGTQQEHRQRETWSLLGLAPFVGEEVTIYNTGISLFLTTSVLVLLSRPPVDREETRPTV